MGAGLEYFEEKNVTRSDVLAKAIAHVFLIIVTFYMLSPIDSQGDIWFLVVVTTVLLLDLISTWKKAKKNQDQTRLNVSFWPRLCKNMLISKLEKIITT